MKISRGGVGELAVDKQTQPQTSVLPDNKGSLKADACLLTNIRKLCPRISVSLHSASVDVSVTSSKMPFSLYPG